MGTLERFGKLRIAVFRDHQPPHVHILGGDVNLVVYLEDLSVVGTGHREAAMALRWLAQNIDAVRKVFEDMNP